MANPVDFAPLLREAIKKSGKQQKAVANAANIDAATVSRWLNGQIPSPRQRNALIDIAKKALQLSDGLTDQLLAAANLPLLSRIEIDWSKRLAGFPTRQEKCRYLQEQQGWQIREIALQLGCSEEDVVRDLDEIRIRTRVVEDQHRQLAGVIAWQQTEHMRSLQQLAKAVWSKVPEEPDSVVPNKYRHPKTGKAYDAGMAILSPIHDRLYAAYEHLLGDGLWMKGLAEHIGKAAYGLDHTGVLLEWTPGTGPRPGPRSKTAEERDLSFEEYSEMLEDAWVLIKTEIEPIARFNSFNISSCRWCPERTVQQSARQERDGPDSQNTPQQTDSGANAAGLET